LRVEGFEIYVERREPVSESLPNVVILHGAGESSLVRSRCLASALVDRGAAVTAFDFPGHGRSSGTMAESSLEIRSEVAYRVIESYAHDRPLWLIGFSMGADTSGRLLMRLPRDSVVGLALFAPAIYDEAAGGVHFGPQFSTAIRRLDSWRDSPISDQLRAYQGRLITFESMHDEVIPEGVVPLIHAAAAQANSKHRLQLLDAPHTIAAWMSEEPERCVWFADALQSLLSSKDQVLTKSSAVRCRRI
jgi:uncharacterized protein